MQHLHISLVSKSIATLLHRQRAERTRTRQNTATIVCGVQNKLHSRSTPVRHPAIGRIKEYIHEHYDEPIALHTLARVAHVSPFHLLRIFRDAEGTTPAAYLTEIRIQNARTMLEQGHSIAETALATGFYDQSHFTNAFRRATGTTPKQYQQNSKILQENEG